METPEISLPCNMTADETIFWCDDGYIFSRVESTYESGTGNRHDLESAIALRDWLNAAIAELEGEKE